MAWKSAKRALAMATAAVIAMSLAAARPAADGLESCPAPRKGEVLPIATGATARTTVPEGTRLGRAAPGSPGIETLKNRVTGRKMVWPLKELRVR